MFQKNANWKSNREVKVIKHYSRVDPEKLLHIVCRSTDEEEEDDPRIDVIPAEQQLQLAILNYE